MNGSGNTYLSTVGTLLMNSAGGQPGDVRQGHTISGSGGNGPVQVEAVIDGGLQAVNTRAGKKVTGSQAPLREVRRSEAAHGDSLVRALLSPPFNDHLPEKLPGWESLVNMMPKTADGQAWNLQTLKRHAKRLAKKMQDIVA